MKKIDLLGYSYYLVYEKKITSPIRLQKILYIFYQEIFLNKESYDLNESLFKNSNQIFEAWKYGPVNTEIYKHFKKFWIEKMIDEDLEDDTLTFYLEDYISNYKLKINNQEDELNSKVLDALNLVVEKTMKFNYRDLIQITHSDKAWIIARKKGLGDGREDLIESDVPTNKKINLLDSESTILSRLP